MISIRLLVITTITMCNYHASTIALLNIKYLVIYVYTSVSHEVIAITILIFSWYVIQRPLLLKQINFDSTMDNKARAL